MLLSKHQHFRFCFFFFQGFIGRKLDKTVAVTASYKNPSYRGFYKASIRAESDWQMLSMDFMTDQDVLGRWDLWGFLFLA